MSIYGNGIRVAALFLAVILAGFFCLSAWTPGTDAEKGKGDNSTSVTSTSGGEDTPGVQEQEQETPAKIARKRFPWLWVAAGVVVVGVVLYFTVFKKPEYKLTVTLGAGVSGTPVAGTFVYKKGKKIHYLYNLGYGYRAMKVTLDKKEVAASGDFTMDGDHTLSVTAEEQFYDLAVTTSAGVTGTPTSGSYSHKVGTSIAYCYSEASGYTDLKVQVDGVDVPAQGTLLMDRAHTLMAMSELIPPCKPSKDEYWSITFTSDTGKLTQSTLYFIGFLPDPPPGSVGFVKLSGGYVGTGNCIIEGAPGQVIYFIFTLENFADGDIAMNCSGMNCTNGTITGEYFIWVDLGNYVFGPLLERGTFSTRRQ
jgi:hypothetical protein